MSAASRTAASNRVEAGEAFWFLVVNDLHFQDERGAPWLERAVAQMGAQPEPVEFCLLLGDLVEEATPEALERVRQFLAALPFPVYVVIGNHDFAAPDDGSAFDRLFPGARNYAFEHRGWQLIGLDTCQGLDYENTRVPAATLAWLDETLPCLDRKRPLLLFTHFPLGADVMMRPVNADEVLERFRDHNLRAVFSGHFHGRSERRVGAVKLVTNRCCSFSRENHDGSSAKGYLVCRAKDDEVDYTFVEVAGDNAHAAD